MVFGNGEMPDFWGDAWCGITPLNETFPELFAICNEQKSKVAEVAKRGWRLSFRRWLDEHLQNRLRSLHDLLSPFLVSVANDTPKWIKGEKGAFSVKSIYKSLCFQEVGTTMSHIWKAKIPLKIKKFMWLIYNNAILTKDNLVKRKWLGDERCSFCCEHETIPHLFFECTMAKYFWSLVALVLGAHCRPISLDQL